MFPFQQRSELSFQVDSNNVENNANNISFQPKLERDVNVYDILQYNQAHNSIPRCPSRRKSRPGRSLLGTSNRTDNGNGNGTEDGVLGNDNDAKKRIMHREIERQRREEMSSLCSSLRDLLPREHLKGKRSVGDHIGEATMYIKDLEKNVKELKDKRDKLKGSLFSSSSEHKLHGDRDTIICSTSSTSLSWTNGFNVSIYAFSRAIEIEITAGIAEEDPFPLSKVLMVLNEEGLDVVSCVSSQVNQRWIYVIHCQDDDALSIDTSQLQWRLTNEIR